MAEGFEPYHVPQQSRRDKLRVVVDSSSPNLPPGCAGLLPLYDPSLISHDLLTCANHLSSNDEASKSNPDCSPKEEGSNLMGFSSSSSSSSVSHFLDPGTIQIINNNPFLFHTQNLREFDQSFNGSSEIMVFKPEEPLSLSLSSFHNNNTHQANYHPLELNLQRYGSAIYGGGSASASNEVVWRSSVPLPLGPYTGYASVLKGSRFLKPAQQLLEELCDIGGRGIYVEKITAAETTSFMEPPSESFSSGDLPPLGDGGEGRKKKSRLLTLLDEVYRRYRQYYQQMHAVVTSFEYVAGLGNAAPYATLAIKAMSKHFKCLKNVITDQLQFTNKAHFHISNRKDEESPRFGNDDHRGPNRQIRPVQNPAFVDHQPVWRPQRGLPERAVTVLRAWLFEHFLHPYPTDTDKLMLAKQTGLSRSQVSNWFINARVRLWKPMVEEIHMLETRQAQKNPQIREDHNRNRSDLISENPSTSTDKFQDTPFKRSRNEPPDLPAVRSHQEHLNLPYAASNNNQPVGVGSVSMAVPGNGVSLTLGLHQNHGINLSEHFPMTAATQRFNLAHEPGTQHYGRDHVIGGQLLHDFVG